VEAAALVAAMVGVLALLTWLAGRARRRGTAGAALAGAMAAYDQTWHPTAHDSYVEVQAQRDRVAPRESPDDL